MIPGYGASYNKTGSFTVAAAVLPELVPVAAAVVAALLSVAWEIGAAPLPDGSLTANAASSSSNLRKQSLSLKRVRGTIFGGTMRWAPRHCSSAASPQTPPAPHQTCGTTLRV